MFAIKTFLRFSQACFSVLALLHSRARDRLHKLSSYTWNNWLLVSILRNPGQQGLTSSHFLPWCNSNTLVLQNIREFCSRKTRSCCIELIYTERTTLLRIHVVYFFSYSSWILRILWLLHKLSRKDICFPSILQVDSNKFYLYTLRNNSMVVMVGSSANIFNTNTWLIASEWVILNPHDVIPCE